MYVLTSLYRSAMNTGAAANLGEEPLHATEPIAARGQGRGDVTREQWNEIRGGLQDKRLLEESVSKVAKCTCGRAWAFVHCKTCTNNHGYICHLCDAALHASMYPFHDRVHIAYGYKYPLKALQTVKCELNSSDVVSAQLDAFLPYNRGCPLEACVGYNQVGVMAFHRFLNHTIKYIRSTGAYTLLGAEFICTKCSCTVSQTSPVHGTNFGFFPASPRQALIHLENVYLDTIMAIQGMKPSTGLEAIVDALSVIGKQERHEQPIDPRTICDAVKEYGRQKVENLSHEGKDPFECPLCYHDEEIGSRHGGHDDADMKIIR